MLTADQRATLLKVARQALRHVIHGDPPPQTETTDSALRRPSGAFVTLKMDGQLRGCLGYIEPRHPLIEAVAGLAIAAALEDPRFCPVTPEEEPRLRIEISVLSPLVPVSNLEAIEIGRHGLVVEQGPYRGLLLPQVAVERGWTREEFLAYTCIKAGLPPDAYRRGASVFWFEAEVFAEDEDDTA